MNRVDDVRVGFYLKHQDSIDEWSKLREQAAQTAHDFLCSFKADTEALNAEFGNDGVISKLDLDSAWPKLLLYRADWRNKDRFVSVGVGWDRKAVGFRRPKSAWVGVWSHQELNDGAAVSESLKQSFKKAAIFESAAFDSTTHWPIYRYTKPLEADYWNDLGPYRTLLRNTMREVWTKCAPRIDEVLMGPR